MHVGAVKFQTAVRFPGHVNLFFASRPGRAVSSTSHPRSRITRFRFKEQAVRSRLAEPRVPTHLSEAPERLEVWRLPPGMAWNMSCSLCRVALLQKCKAHVIVGSVREVCRISGVYPSGMPGLGPWDEMDRRMDEESFEGHVFPFPCRMLPFSASRGQVRLAYLPCLGSGG